jgi:MerR family transcriptional regulator, light-induced transcriptional regulator
MDTAQIAGARLNRERNEIADAVALRIVRNHADFLTKFDMPMESLREYALHDLSKLFVAVISHRPPLFEKYVRWQRSVFHHRDVPAIAILTHLTELEAELAERLEPEEFVTVQAAISAGYDALDGILDGEAPWVAGDTPLGAIAEEYLRLLLDRRAVDAVEMIERAVADGLSLEDIYLHVLEPVQREVGRLWQVNSITVADEHYATDTTRTVMTRLRARFTPDRRREVTVLTACLGGELHDLGARMVNDFLHLSGFDTVFIGANTPYQAILQELSRTSADVLALSATMTLQVRNAVELIDRLRREYPGHLPVLVGGYAFNQADSLWRDVGADGWAPRADEAAATVEELLHGRPGRIAPR